MGAFGLRLDPSGTVLNIADNSAYTLLGLDAPEAPLSAQWAGAAGVDGDLLVDSRYGNRQVSAVIRVVGSTDAQLEDRVQALQAAVTKQHREGGELELTTPAGTVVTFDVLDASFNVILDKRYMTRQVAQVTLVFTCKPFARGAEQDLGDNVETTLPALVFTEASIPGDVPALGRLVVDEDDAEDQLTVMWGVRSRNYSAAATAGLFWQAEALTPVSAGAATVAGPSGAHGSGSNTIEATALTTKWQDVLKSTVGSTYFTHVGAYRVIARVQADSANTGSVQVRASWGLGDLAVYQQGAAADTTAGGWVLCDLGVVNVPQAVTGTHRWELRVQAKSTVNGDDAFVDWLLLIPVDESAGVAQATTAGTSLVTRVHDTFEQTAGNLDGKTPAPTTDGNWAESSAGEFTLDTTNDVAQRTSVSDTAGLANAKLAVASTVLAGSWASVELDPATWPAYDHTAGVLLRHVDASNWLGVVAYFGGYLRIYKCVAGTVTLLGQSVAGFTGTPVIRVRATAYANGLVTGDLSVDGVPVVGCTVTDSALATGGALDDGKVGIIDHYPSATACTRRYDNFQGGTLDRNAACFAGQSIRIAHDGVVREDAAGNVWGDPGKVEGDLLLIPPSGREGRACEVVVKMSRALLGSPGDLAADDLSARLYATARWNTIPT